MAIESPRLPTRARDVLARCCCGQGLPYTRRGRRPTATRRGPSSASYASMLSQLWERLDRAQRQEQAAVPGRPRHRLAAPGGSAGARWCSSRSAATRWRPSGSLVGATGADGRPLTFRTEFGIGLSASPLAEVWSVVPQRDAVGAHAAAVAGGPAYRPLRRDRRRSSASLYVGHAELLASTAPRRSSSRSSFAEACHVQLDITWSTWDGTSWREFLARRRRRPHEGHDRSAAPSGIETQCIKSERTEVDGVESYWLRGALRTALTPDPFRRLPVIDQLRHPGLGRHPPAGLGSRPAGAR